MLPSRFGRPFFLVLVISGIASSALPPFAQASTYYLGQNHQLYRLSEDTGDWQAVKTKAQDIAGDPDQFLAPTGETVHLSPDGQISHGLDPTHLEPSPLRPPPPGMTYERVHFDTQNNLWVELGGLANGGRPANGFNFVGGGGFPVIVANRTRWEDGTIGPKDFKRLAPDTNGEGMYALLNDGSVEKISPPAYGRDTFSRQQILPPGTAQDMVPAAKGVVLDFGGGRTGRLEKNGKVKNLVSHPAAGRIFSSADRGFAQAMQQYAASLPPPSRPFASAASLGAKVKNLFTDRSWLPSLSKSSKGNSSFSTQELSTQIAERRARVPEFEFIKKEAEKLGVRVYLFGGTASAYAHYVNWDLKREHGDTRYQKEKFDYDYSTIYRSTQDLDIVMDGTKEQAEALQEALAENFPHFQGGKTAWEVRLLKSDLGDKEALLNNPNYLNQHSDSNSTGLIELTDPKPNEPVVRDLLDWSSREPHFLKDVHDGKIHYYFSPKHGTTARAIAGQNPPILSAIRLFTKAFQYDLEIRPDEERIARQIIRDFRPESITDSYVKKWIEKNGKKIIQNAVNMEAAWKKSKEIGLTDKLIQFSGDVAEVDSLAWWMSRQPLLSKPVGKGKGRTAAQVFALKGVAPDAQGRLVIAHEPRAYLAYESITRSTQGEPNVLISRNGFPGETAIYGDGFYAAMGREGAVGTGLHIRFVLDPTAREGEDFLFDEPSGYFVMQNKSAFKVIPESLNLSLPAFFETLAKDDSLFASDQGILEKMRRQVLTKAVLYEDDEMDKVAKIVMSNMTNPGKGKTMLGEWLRIPEKARGDRDQAVVKEALAQGDLHYHLARLADQYSFLQKQPEIARARQLVQNWEGQFERQLAPARDLLTRSLQHPKAIAQFEQLQDEYEKNFIRVLGKASQNETDMKVALSLLNDYKFGEVSRPIIADFGRIVTEFMDQFPQAASKYPDPMFKVLFHEALLEEKNEKNARRVEKLFLGRWFRPGKPVLSSESRKEFVSNRYLTEETLTDIMTNWRQYSSHFQEKEVFEAFHHKILESLLHEQNFSYLPTEKRASAAKITGALRSYGQDILPLAQQYGLNLGELDKELKLTLTTIATSPEWHTQRKIRDDLVRAIGELIENHENSFPLSRNHLQTQFALMKALDRNANSQPYGQPGGNGGVNCQAEYRLLYEILTKLTRSPH